MVVHSPHGANRVAGVPVFIRVVDAVRILIAVKSLGVITGDLFYTLLKLIAIKAVFNINGNVSAAGEAGKSMAFNLPSNFGLSAALNLYLAYFGNMLISVVIFILILLSTGALTVMFSRWASCPSENVRANCLKGASFIPAWAWRDVIASFIAAAMILMSRRPEVVASKMGLEAADIDAALLAMGITIGSAVFSVYLETKALHLEKGTFWRGIVDSLRNAFAMGVAYAFNILMDNLFGVNAADGTKLAIYLGSLSIVIPCAQHYGQMEADLHRDQMNHTLYVAIEFTLLAMRWVLGWAWREVLILYVSELHGNVLAYFIVAMVTTFIGITVVVLLQVAGEHDFDGTLVVGMNLGWVWKKFSWQCFHALYGDDPKFWLLPFHTVVTIICVGIVAAVLDAALTKAKGVPKIPDEQVLLLSARDRMIPESPLLRDSLPMDATESQLNLLRNK